MARNTQTLKTYDYFGKLFLHPRDVHSHGSPMASLYSLLNLWNFRDSEYHPIIYFHCLVQIRHPSQSWRHLCSKDWFTVQFNYQFIRSVCTVWTLNIIYPILSLYPMNTREAPRGKRTVLYICICCMVCCHCCVTCSFVAREFVKSPKTNSYVSRRPPAANHATSN